MPTYHPKVYKTSGGDTLNIASGGELQIAGTAFITSGGGVNIGSLTSGDVTLPGALTVSSGLAVTGASTFAAGVKVSSGLLVSEGSSFSTGIKVSGASTFAEAVAFSTGIAVTGNSTFSAAITVSSGVNALKGVFTSAVNGTTGKFTGDLSALGFVSGITVGTSSGGALTLASLMTVKSTAGDPVLYTVAPQAGYICYIRCAASCATSGAAIVTTTGTWDGSNANLLFSTGVTNPQFVGFIGLSTSRWQVLTTAYTTEVSFTNT